MFETSLLASKAFHAAAKTDPLKSLLGNTADQAENNYGRALINGLTANSPAIEEAVKQLDNDNTVARDALAKTKTTAAVLAALQKAVDAGVKLLALV
jgi:hypothetical protein